MNKNILLIGLSIVIAGVIIGIAIVSSNSPQKASIKDSIKNTVDTEIVSADVDDDAIKGNPNAPVTIIEFSDYQCPFCARFYLETLPQIEEKYIKTGKVKFVYRDFPLSNHAYAQKSAEASECAGEQDKFWEYHNLLFENQREWSQKGSSKLKEYAVQLGLNADRFDKCLDRGEMEDEVKKDFSDGSRLGVQGTPAFFINGKFVSGAQPFRVFEEMIEKELRLCEESSDGTCEVDL